MDKFKLVRARLILAQELLEESDNLPGAEGYKPDLVNFVDYHPRHEREALVVYLLLTCFDLLGQTREYISFYDWLCSNKPDITDERKKVLDELDIAALGLVEGAKLINEGYNRLYGATRAFFAGIEELPPKAKAHLLSSVSVSKRNPESFKPENKNTGYPPIPIEDKKKEEKMKLSSLYSLRNAFTHNLSQMHRSSLPIMAQFLNGIKPESAKETEAASWGVSLFGDVIGTLSHDVYDPKYIYGFKDWPFILFEVLYAAIGEVFDRTQIKLKMHIFDPDKGSMLSIPHADLPWILEEVYRVPFKKWNF